MEFSVKDSLRSSIESASGGRNTVMYDDVGNPNIMVCIPSFDAKLLGLTAGTHPAFRISEDKEVNEIWVSKYICTPGEMGVPASMNPSENLFYDLTARSSYRADIPTAIEKIKRKGKGWHLMTNVEYCAVFQQSACDGVLAQFKNESDRALMSLEGLSHDGTPFGVIANKLTELVDGFTMRYRDTIYTWMDSNKNLINDFINRKFVNTGIQLDGSKATYPSIHYYDVTTGQGTMDTPVALMSKVQPLSGHASTWCINTIKLLGLANVSPNDVCGFGCVHRTTNTKDDENIVMQRNANWGNTMDFGYTAPMMGSPLSYTITSKFNVGSYRAVYVNLD